MIKNGMKILGCMMFLGLLVSCPELISLEQQIKDGDAWYNYDLNGTSWESVKNRSTSPTGRLTITTNTWNEAKAETILEEIIIKPLIVKKTSFVVDRKKLLDEFGTFTLTTWEEIAVDITTFTRTFLDDNPSLALVTFDFSEIGDVAGEVEIEENITYNFLAGQNIGEEKTITTGKWISEKNKLGELLYYFTKLLVETTTYDYTTAIDNPTPNTVSFDPTKVTETTTGISTPENDVTFKLTPGNGYTVEEKNGETVLQLQSFDSRTYTDLKLLK